ncbi:hypothetical protein CLV42_1501, partial [Chitinophaga ginsengisoli]
MRYLISLILLLFLNKNSKAQDNSGCTCNYYSYFDMKSYLSTTDSLVKKIRRDKHEVIQVIGSRAYAVAMITVVVNRNNIKKVHCYNLRSKKYKIVTGKQIDTWLQGLLQDSSFIHTAKASPSVKSHPDNGYFISFNYPSVPLKEICHSVILSNLERPFAKSISSYLIFFNEQS